MAKGDYKEIKDEIYKIVKDACFSPKNQFTYTVWDYHIVPVVEHGLVLGEKLNADLEILELSALLHDYASLVDFELYEQHHLHGAELAEKILKKFQFSQNKIDHIKECIISHRGSVRLDMKTIEAKILASADAMSHITELADMFYLTFGIHKYKTPEGSQWLKGKIERSWDKIMPEGKELIQDDYNLALKIINKAINKQK